MPLKRISISTLVLNFKIVLYVAIVFPYQCKIMNILYCHVSVLNVQFVFFLQLVPDNWRDSADRTLLEMGGVETHHNDRQEM